MKKWIIRIAIVLVLLAVVAGVAISLSLDKAIKAGVETIGPKLTQVDVKLDGVKLSILSGSGAIKGLVIGNPDGYKTPEAISLGLASVSISPGSIFSDKIIVKSIRIEAPKVTFELGPGGNNLQRIQENLGGSTAGEAPTPSAGEKPAESKPGKKLQVDEVLITGGTVTLGAALLGGKLIEAPLPTIRMSELGQGPEGITGAELGKKILSQINEEAIKTYTDQLAKAGAEALQNVSKNATNVLDKATKGLGDLLNRKKE